MVIVATNKTATNEMHLRRQMSLICGERSTSHVAHVIITHVAHVIDSHVAHVTDSHVAHVIDSILAGNVATDFC